MTKRYVMSVSFNEDELKILNAVIIDILKKYPPNSNLSNSYILKMIISSYYVDNELSINRSTNEI